MGDESTRKKGWAVVWEDHFFSIWQADLIHILYYLISNFFTTLYCILRKLKTKSD